MAFHNILFRQTGRNLLINKSPVRSIAGIRSYTSTLARATEELEGNRDLFEYTSGRWLFVLS